jgi:hypothetical protein
MIFFSISMSMVGKLGPTEVAEKGSHISNQPDVIELGFREKGLTFREN